jgi:hypothetical protein
LIFVCPICRVEKDCHDLVWFYTCSGCGSGINLVGIWWKLESGQNWFDLSVDEKKKIGEKYYDTNQNRTEV